MQTYLSGKFLVCLVNLFESDDARERDFLKTLLHRIYGRFMPLRTPIRNLISNVYYEYIYSNSRHNVNGISEFLDIFC